MNEKHPIGEFMGTTMEKIREMIDVNTVIGQPINTADGVTVIPVSKVSFGFASGGSDFQTKNGAANKANPFGGGGGAGVKISPVAFLVVKEGSVRVLNIEPPASNTLDRVVDAAPDLIDKIAAMLKKEEKDPE